MLGSIIVALTCVVNLSLGSLILIRNPRRSFSISFFLVTLLVSLWSVSNFLTSSPDVGLAFNNVFNRLAFLFGFLAVLTAWGFSTVFPRPVAVSVLARRLAVGLGAFVGILSVNNLVAGTVARSNGELIFTVGRLLPAYIIAILLFLGLILRNLVYTYKANRGAVRQQTVYILLGFSLPIFLGIISNGILPLFTGSWQTADSGPVFTIVLVVTISYAIVRHHLFDLRLAVARSFAYLLSITALALLYAAGVFDVSRYLFDLHISATQELFMAGLSAALALFFQPAKTFFDRMTNRLFYRDAYDAQSFLDQLNRLFVAYVDLERLLTEAAQLIKENFRAEFCMFGTRDPSDRTKPLIIGSDKPLFSAQDIALGQHYIPDMPSVIVTDDLSDEHGKLKRALYKNNIAVMIRLGASGNTENSFGYLIVGNKKSGNPYNQQDVRVLETAANGLVVALQNVFRFEEIRNFNQTLEQKIEEATRKLRQTNDKLRKLDQTKDDFISMASHQLRTPLTSVKGYTSMVLDGDAGRITALQRRLLNQSFISAQRMVYLISDLLNVSRLKTGKFLIDAMPTNLAQVISQEIDQLVETAKSRNLQLTFHRPEHFPTLMLDETKIRQVIMNFIDNAIYYTPSGGHITVNLVDKPTSVEFFVIDDGIGVPRHDQFHLFSKFYRANNAKQARPDGTGLGLFMAKKVVIAQGGAIIFKSREGKGSTFGFMFPKAKILVPPKS